MSERVILAAELGINHGGSLDTALRMVDAAAAAGCDAVKVQVFRADEFCAPSATYQGEAQAQMFKRYELGQREIEAVAVRCSERGVAFFGTATSGCAMGILVAAGARWIKVGSDDINNHPLLRAIGRDFSGDYSVILSTGMASCREIDAALEVLRSEKANVWGLMHCTSMYPCPAQSVNLRRMHSLPLMIGFSDHTDGHEAAIAAVALGARMIEKHFTLDRSMPGPDHAFSETPESMAALIKSVRRVEAMLGDGLVDPQPEEIRMRYTARRFAVAARSMVAGTRLALGDIAAKRCAADHMCFEPPEIPGLVGRILVRARVEGEPIRVGDLE